MKGPNTEVLVMRPALGYAGLDAERVFRVLCDKPLTDCGNNPTVRRADIKLRVERARLDPVADEQHLIIGRCIDGTVAITTSGHRYSAAKRKEKSGIQEALSKIAIITNLVENKHSDHINFVAVHFNISQCKSDDNLSTALVFSKT